MHPSIPTTHSCIYPLIHSSIRHQPGCSAASSFLFPIFHLAFKTTSYSTGYQPPAHAALQPQRIKSSKVLGLISQVLGNLIPVCYCCCLQSWVTHLISTILGPRSRYFLASPRGFSRVSCSPPPQRLSEMCCPNPAPRTGVLGAG